jgi:hypothetical protein
MMLADALPEHSLSLREQAADLHVAISLQPRENANADPSATSLLAGALTNLGNRLSSAE